MIVYFNCYYSLKSLRHEKKPQKQRYLRRSYVFIEHFMAFNINTLRKMHKTAHHHNTRLNSPHQPSLKKNAPPFCLRSLINARFKCVFFIVNKTCCVSRRRSESAMKTVNAIIAHVTNYVICTYPTRTWLNIHRPFVSQGNHFDGCIVIKRQQIQIRCCIISFYVFAVYIDILIIHTEINAFHNVLSRNSDAKIMWPEPESGWCCEHLGGRYCLPTYMYQSNPGPVLAHCNIYCG